MRERAGRTHIAPMECWHWIRKLQARFFLADYVAALVASHHAQGLKRTSPGVLERTEHELYSALAHAALCDSPSSDEGRHQLEAINARDRQSEVLSCHCSENFENRALLVAAEIARIEGREADPIRLYEQPVHSPRENVCSLPLRVSQDAILPAFPISRSR